MAEGKIADGWCQFDIDWDSLEATLYGTGWTLRWVVSAVSGQLKVSVAER